MSGRPRRPGARRWAGIPAAIAGCLLLSACAAPQPEVTFFGNRTALETGPTRWCQVDVTAQDVACVETAEQDVQRLTLRAGQSVQINVPSEIGDTPWAVYFRYRDADGELQDGRSEIFTERRLAYTLQPFAEQDQLVYVEVRSGFILMGGETSGVDFAATQSWLLLIDPVAQPATAEAG